MESDETDDSDEDGPDGLHLVGQDGPGDCQAEHQQVDDLNTKLAWSEVGGERYPDGVGLNQLDRPLVDDDHGCAWH